jgi:rSAM/selenodomain-associated transferase 1
LSKAIITFVKNPVPGTVKTRLAKTIGNDRALDIYLQLSAYTKRTIKAIDADVVIFYAADIQVNDLWTDDDFQKKLQHGEDLGARMQHAFKTLLTDYDKVLIVGSDCPQLKEHHLNTAFNSLDETDIVVGPTFDGGYYMIGMKELHRFLFEDIAWSTDAVFPTTLQRIFANYKTVTQLEKLSDVDVEDDLKYIDWL